jgi:hypothetical protein
LPEGTLWDPSNLDLPNPVPCGLVQGPEPATLVDSDTSAGSLCAMPHVNCTAFDCAPTFDLWSVCATPTPGAKNVR